MKTNYLLKYILSLPLTESCTKDVVQKRAKHGQKHPSHHVFHNHPRWINALGQFPMSFLQRLIDRDYSQPADQRRLRLSHNFLLGRAPFRRCQSLFDLPCDPFQLDLTSSLLLFQFHPYFRNLPRSFSEACQP